MTLWNIIRDFFVNYVFGGMDSSGAFVNYTLLGNILSYDTEDILYGPESTASFYLTIGGIWPDDGGLGYPTPYTYISLGDWLSTTATIITLVGLFIAITMFIIKLVKWISNAISMR